MCPDVEVGVAGVEVVECCCSFFAGNDTRPVVGREGSAAKKPSTLRERTWTSGEFWVV